MTQSPWVSSLRRLIATFSKFTVLALLILIAGASARAQSDGFTESVVLNAGFDGTNPSGLLQAADGNFYGVAVSGGSADAGAVYKVTPTGTASLVYSFCTQSHCADGEFPSSTLIQGSDGNFYGSTSNGGANDGGVAYKVTPSGTYTVLYAFCAVYSNNKCTDGSAPGQLVQGSDGNFYGVAGGGTNTYGAVNDDGLIFQLTPAGKLTVLHQFCSEMNCTDGTLPGGGLVQGSNGSFYGLAAFGGSTGYGVAYQVSSTGSFSVIHNFCLAGHPACTDGAAPVGTLVEALDSSFFGVASIGGANIVNGEGGGTLFNLSAGGTLNTLYSFCSQTNCADGYSPSSVYLATDGNYYGTTSDGGPAGSSQPLNSAVVFRLSGSTESTVYTFCAISACTDGEEPSGALVQGADGNLYGAASYGGAYGDGAVYKLTHAPALAGPVHLSFSESTVAVGGSTTLAWSVAEAYSLTLQQCYAFIQNGATGGGAWSGKDPGSSGGSGTDGSVTIKPTVAGTYTYVLTCGGIESGFATLTVTATPSSTKLAQSPMPISVGQPLTLKATVAGTGGTPTGSVTFYYGSIALEAAPLLSGVASLALPTYALPAGSYVPITAVYSGDSNFATSTSAAATVVLQKAATATALLAAPKPVTPPANVTFTATVKRTASGASGAPTGTVGFYLGTNLLATAPLNSSGVATYTIGTNGVPAGSYAFTAKYNADASDNASTSPVTTVPVN